jgi:hypothetical protein
MQVGLLAEGRACCEEIARHPDHHSFSDTASERGSSIPDLLSTYNCCRAVPIYFLHQRLQFYGHGENLVRFLR